MKSWPTFLRWIAALATVLLLYSVIGFWALPAWVEAQWPKWAQSELGRQGSVGEVEFNPFSLRLHLADLKLAEADGTAILSAAGVTVAPQWRSITRRAYSFREVRISQPKLNLVIGKDGRFNLAELRASLDREPRPEKTEGIARVIVEHLAVEGGELTMQDQRAGYSNQFSPIDFELARFSTLPEESESHTLSAESKLGGRLRWKGTASVNPIRASGEISLENVSLSGIGAYLKPHVRGEVSAGALTATIPYVLAYDNGQLAFQLAGAKATLQDLKLAAGTPGEPLVALSQLRLDDLHLDLAARQVRVGTFGARGGKLRLRRDAKGEFDIAQWLASPTRPSPPAAAPSAPASQPAKPSPWQVALNQLQLDDVALAAVDEMVDPPLQLGVERAQLRLQARASFGGEARMQASDGALTLSGVTLAQGSQPSLRVERMGVEGAAIDASARTASIRRAFAERGKLSVQRSAQGEINLLKFLPQDPAKPDAKPASKAPATAAKPPASWQASVARADLTGWDVDIDDKATGVTAQLTDVALGVAGWRADGRTPLQFDAGLRVRQGGQLSAKGSFHPGTSAVQADLNLRQLALAPLQPWLSRHVKLKLAGGNVSAVGKLQTGTGERDSPRLRYEGGVSIAALRLDELNGESFASWRDVRTGRLTASLGPNRLNIPELILDQPSAKLLIEADRSFNASRLLVQGGDAKAKPAKATSAGAAVPAPGDAESSFPIRVGRVRLQEARLEFADLSLRPPFGARMYEMNGTLAGVSTRRDAPSQVELVARVDEFGSARIEGRLNPFALTDDTDVRLVFRNLDMVNASPYTMKFAGYRVAEGRMSLDLRYQVKARQLQATNQIVMDRLRLGERVDSPDALKLPLELAIAILKDRDGRINVGVPISGNLNDPQFSYGEIIGKAIANLLGRVVTAPFRALGNLLGVSGEKLESVEFAPGSDQLDPPEREKILQMAQAMRQREGLALSVPGAYSEAADGAALRTRALRLEVARRIGQASDPTRDPGPPDLESRSTRRVLRELYEARFGEAELDKARQAAEQSGQPGASGAAPASPGLVQRVGNLVRGEPQVADAMPFYRQLFARLEREQPLAQDALVQLAARRSSAVVEGLRGAGVDAARLQTGQNAAVQGQPGEPVPLRLGLAAARG